MEIQEAQVEGGSTDRCTENVQYTESAPKISEKTNSLNFERQPDRNSDLFSTNDGNNQTGALAPLGEGNRNKTATFINSIRYELHPANDKSVVSGQCAPITSVSTKKRYKCRPD